MMGSALDSSIHDYLEASKFSGFQKSHFQPRKSHGRSFIPHLVLAKMHGQRLPHSFQPMVF